MNNLWDDDIVSDRDLIEEIDESENLARAYDAQPIISKPSEEQIEQIQQNAAFDLDEEEVDIVYNARLRLEQAKLYEMLINHNMFENVDADTNAIENVQGELKQFIVERLEILLGIRQEKIRATKAIATEIQLPFNEIEIDFLKQLSYKGTKGASIGAAPTKISESSLKPLATNKISSSLKPLAPTPKRSAPIASTTKVNKPKGNKTKTDIKTTQLVKKNTPQSQIRSNSIATRNLTKDEIEALAKQDIEEMSKRKPWAKMTSKEKAQEIAKVNERHAKPKVESAMPMPTPEQIEQKYLTEQTMMASTNKLASLHNTIAHRLINGQFTKIKSEE